MKEHRNIWFRQVRSLWLWKERVGSPTPDDWLQGPDNLLIDSFDDELALRIDVSLSFCHESAHVIFKLFINQSLQVGLILAVLLIGLKVKPPILTGWSILGVILLKRRIEENFPDHWVLDLTLNFWGYFHLRVVVFHHLQLERAWSLGRRSPWFFRGVLRLKDTLLPLLLSLLLFRLAALPLPEVADDSVSKFVLLVVVVCLLSGHPAEQVQALEVVPIQDDRDCPFEELNSSLEIPHVHEVVDCPA